MFLNRKVLKEYYTLTKPRMVYGNLLTAAAGFVLASRGQVDILLMLTTLFGLSLVVASGCVFNNYIDRDIDGLMERTKERALVKGVLPLRGILGYGATLAALGFPMLALYTNIATFVAAFVGTFVYVVVYSLWLKRSSSYSTLIGGISGAMPPLIGYLAVRGYLDFGAILLFFILALWQLPHFFAIAIYRLEEYKAASIPVLPGVKGILRTKIEMLGYTFLFVVATLLLHIFGYTGNVYFTVMALLGGGWVILCLLGFFIPAHKNKEWGRTMFIFSIFVLMTFCGLLGLGGVLG